MKYIKRYVLYLIIVASIASIVFFVLSIKLPKAQPVISSSVTDTKNIKKKVTYAAIGDSLTEGIGDSTSQGGYVPILGKMIQRKFSIKKVETTNFGKSGDRSDQILKRLNENEEMQTAVEDADVVGITAGANDLMKIVRNNLFSDISETTFTKPKEDYKKSLLKLLEEVRTLNPNAAVYVIGIYNPYYLQFSDITEVQDIVDEWNTATKEVVDEQTNMTFVPINDIIYRGLNDSSSVSSSSSTTSDSTSTSESINNLISDEDNFHPNNLGYQLMADAVFEAMTQTKEEWLYKTK